MKSCLRSKTQLPNYYSNTQKCQLINCLQIGLQPIFFDPNIYKILYCLDELKPSKLNLLKFFISLITKQSITKRGSQARCDLHAYSKRVNKFRMALTKYPWIELLIAMTHNKGRRPTKLELLLINKILYIIKVRTISCSM